LVISIRKCFCYQITGKVDIIIGTVGIIVANAMMGEVTPKMAEAVANSPAKKLLIPLTQENIEIIGLSTTPLPHLIEILLQENLKNFYDEVQHG